MRRFYYVLSNKLTSVVSKDSQPHGNHKTQTTIRMLNNGHHHSSTNTSEFQAVCRASQAKAISIPIERRRPPPLKLNSLFEEFPN